MSRSSEEGGRTSGGGTSSPVRSQNGIGVVDRESAATGVVSRSSSTSDSTLRSSESISSSSCAGNNEFYNNKQVMLFVY